MPWYEIDHVTPLTREQCDRLAQRITDIHAHKFTTPKLFVNIHFRYADNDWTYIGGKAVTNPSSFKIILKRAFEFQGRSQSDTERRQERTNRIKAHVRVGQRTKEDFDDLALKIVDAWNAVVDSAEEPGDGSRELRTVFVVGEIVAGVEAGLVLPGVS